MMNCQTNETENKEQCSSNNANIITEAKPKRARKRICDLTDEQRAKRAAYWRKRRENLTAEQKARISEHMRMRRASFTPEQRAQKAERDRQRRANLTPEQKAKIAEYERKRQPVANAKRRAKREERERQWLASLANEQSAQNPEHECHDDKAKNMHKKRGYLTEKERARNTEYDRKRRLKEKTEEQRLRRKEVNRKYRANLLTKEFLQLKKVPIETETNTFLNNHANSSEHPLQDLIIQVILNNTNVEIIPYLDNELFRRILKMFAFVYPKNKSLLAPRYAMKRTIYEIDINYLVGLLQKWEGWKIYHPENSLNSLESCENLFNYLRNHFEKYQLYRDKCLLEELDIYFITETYITLKCPLKQLKSMFYPNPHNHKHFFKEDVCISSSSYKPNDFFSDFVASWPFVSTQITLPNFSMTHDNVHTDEYQLINITNGMKTDLSRLGNSNPLIKVKNNRKTSVLIPTNLITTFLSQLKTVINTIPTNELILKQKVEILMALTEFEKDIAYCTDTIESKTEYFISLSPYPYTRYLSHTDDGVMKIPIAEQKSIKDPTLNVRLQEIRYPKIYFNLHTFSMPYEFKNDDVHFILDNTFLSELNNCILYTCVLCDVSLGSCSTSQEISDHMLNYHGLEPDWECVKCLKSFSNEYLIQHRWYHDCR